MSTPPVLNAPPVLSAVVIGCGRIAGGAPAAADAPADAEELTHAGAYAAHPGYQLIACIEPDTERRRAFCKRWNIPQGFASLDEALKSSLEFDVASVCTPTPMHAEILGQLLKTPLRAVFCEKPLTDSLAESERLVTAYQKADKLLAVAYLRRWNPAMAELKRELVRGDWGELRTAIGTYTKGALNNGSHLIDLMHYLCGPLRLKAVTGTRIDADKADPTIDAVLETKSGAPLHLIGADSRDYALFELQLISERGVIAIESSGLVIRRRGPVDDPLHSGYKTLDHGDWRECGHGDPFRRALDNIAAALDGTGKLASDGENALEAQRICTQMIEQARNL
jgi:predicted dehydrogenase